MDLNYRDHFIEQWHKYFPNAELPITYYYSDNEGMAQLAKIPDGHRCFIADLARVRRGESLVFDKERIGCGGAMRYLGFNPELREGFEYFLSCGKEGLEGERYKKSPQIVNEMLAQSEIFNAPNPYLIVKRWDKLTQEDNPLLVSFFAIPDVLSGLFTLAGYEDDKLHSVITPFCAGCGALLYHPYLEYLSEDDRAVIGMFDVSARPFVQANILTITFTMRKMKQMISNFDESFLITGSWEKVKSRIKKQLTQPLDDDLYY